MLQAKIFRIEGKPIMGTHLWERDEETKYWLKRISVLIVFSFTELAGTAIMLFQRTCHEIS